MLNDLKTQNPFFDEICYTINNTNLKYFHNRIVTP